jgi:hypothetical protein
VIDLLSSAVTTLRGGVVALKADTAELRAAYERVRREGTGAPASSGTRSI